MHLLWIWPNKLLVSVSTIHPISDSISHMIDHSFHIAFCVDNHYFKSMGATIASIVVNNPDRHFTFHVFAFSATDDQRNRLQSLEKNPHIKTQLHIVDMTIFNEFAEMIASSYYSLSTFTRLILPAALKEATDRVLYLDADMLCVDNIDALTVMHIEDTIACVISDVGWQTRNGRDGRYSTLQLKHPRYFNAGVMYINIPRWEASKISQQTITLLLHEKKRLAFNDQDALNIVLDGKARFISVRWNYIYSMIADLKNGQLVMKPFGNAVFIHFAGAIKPWNEWSGHEAKNLYLYYHAKSVWADMPLDPAPTNYKEMRIFATLLAKQGKYFQSFKWYRRYLTVSLRKKLK